MDSVPAHPPQQQQQLSAPVAPQIRSRITVVCAECKRLKLKCDRRTPCGSCTKRDTVPRCIYSPAAAEKVDLHSLNNRLIVVEASLAQLAAAGISSAAFNSSLHPPSRGNGASGAGSDNTSSFLSLSLPDVAASWLDELDLDKSVYPSSYFSADPAAGSCASPSHAAQQGLAAAASAYSSSHHIKVEPTPTSLPAITPRSPSPDSEGDDGVATSLLLPPLSIYHAPRPSSQTSPSVTGSPVSSFPHTAQSLSPALLELLPSVPVRRALLDVVHRSMLLRPFFNFPHFRGRIDNLFDDDNREESDQSPKSKAAVARAIFFGPPSTTSASPTPSKPHGSSPSLLLTSPTMPISFFAAVAAAFALGSQLSPFVTNRGDAGESSMMVDGDSGSRKRHGAHKPRHKSSNRSGKPSPAFLYALSVQALAVHEERAPFDLDYLIACLLQVRFLLQGGEGTVRKARTTLGNTSAGGTLFPLVGRMVTVAREMGLASDPDESPGRFDLFEAETRRRVWWDVFCHDVFVSDSMGHPPLISDSSYSTRLPGNVDELAFSPASTALPVVGDAEMGWSANGSKYFELKCQLAQHVKRVKRRICSPELLYNIDHAAALEAEIKGWLESLPAPWRLGMDVEQREGGKDDADAHVLIMQRCELVIVAQRLVLRLYLPFLRQSSGNNPTPVTATIPQASYATVNAAHMMMHACKVLHMWRKRADVMQVSPAVFDHHSFERTVFDAAVICAHAAIKQPTAVWAGPALDDVASALKVLCDSALEDKPDAEGELPIDEAIKIVEMLKKKAERAREAGVGCAGWTRIKRKHGEVENEVGSGVATGGQPLSFVQLPPPTPTKVTVEPLGDRLSPRGPLTSDVALERARAKYEGLKATGESGVKDKDREKEKEKERERQKEKEKGLKQAKKAHYPHFGIRIRPGKDGLPLTRQRAGSTATASSTSEGPSSAAPVQQSPLSSLPKKTASSHPSTPIPNDVGFHPPQSTVSHDPSLYHQPTPLSLSENPVGGDLDFLGYGGDGSPMNVDSQRRRYSIHEHPHSHAQAQQPQQQYASFSTRAPRMYEPTRGSNFERSRAATFDFPQSASYDHSHGKPYTTSPSSYTGGQVAGPSEPASDPSSPFGSGNGSMASTLPSSSFGPTPALSHPSGAPTFGPNPSGEYFVHTGFESDYDGSTIHHAQDMSPVSLGITTSPFNGLPNLPSSVPAAHYDKTSQPVYDALKPPDHHHSRSTIPPQQYQVNHSHDPSHHHHHHVHSSSGTLPPPQSWSQATPAEDGGDYWPGADFKYYH